MVHEEIKKIAEKIKNKGLIMSRVPDRVRQAFKELAEKEFADDYGMAFKFVFDRAMEASVIYSTFDTKLNYIIQLLESIKGGNQEKPEKKRIKLLSGREIKR